MSDPQIEMLQFNSENVNSFLGDVNLHFSLVKLPSRGNLDVSVEFFYSSNVTQEAQKWNLDSNNQVLGLGWQFDFQKIELKVDGSLCHKVYTLSLGNNDGTLSESSEEWKLFNLTTTFVGTLNENKVSRELINAFLENSHLLSTQATVTTLEKSTKWKIEDPLNERDFFIQNINNALHVSDGGQLFSLISYKFWKISFYKRYERWLIKKENGLSYSFGGILSQQQETHVLQYGVKWGNWIGTSSLIEGQARYVKVWNLASMSNSWGDQVNFTYIVNEQAVGNELGQKYTKACYLNSIFDSLGKKINFYYKEKLPGEVIDPHKNTPNNIPNAFQDTYEENYLDQVILKNSADQLLLQFNFDYSIHNVTGKNPVDKSYSETSKRFLTEVKTTNHMGYSPPSIKLGYYLNPEDINPGAIQTITNAKGAVTTYSYEKLVLENCQRDVRIYRPDEGLASEQWVPRFWTGSDYTIAMWYNYEKSKFRLSIFTWIGFWYEWPIDTSNFPNDIDINSLTTAISQNSFAICYNNKASTQTNMVMYHKNLRCEGVWFESNFNTYLYDYNKVVIGAGNDYFTVLDVDKAVLNVYTWNWETAALDPDCTVKTNQWLHEKKTLDAMFSTSLDPTTTYFSIGNSRHYFIVHQYDYANSFCRFQLFYQNQLGKWFKGGYFETDEINILIKDKANIFWSLSESFAVACYNTHFNKKYMQYGIHIFALDENYDISLNFKQTDLQSDGVISSYPTFVGNKLLSSGKYLYRYNGTSWLQRELDVTLSPDVDNNLFWLAAGDDNLLLTENSSSQIISTLALFDPDMDSTHWNTQFKIINDVYPSNHRQMNYFPTSASNYLSSGKNFYFKGHSNNWDAAITNPIYTIPSDNLIDTTTMVNQDPRYFVYLEYSSAENNTPEGVRVLNLQNGVVKNYEFIKENFYQIYDTEGQISPYVDGFLPSGADTLITFSPVDKEFSQADFFTLRRWVLGGVENCVSNCSVTKVMVDNGFEQQHEYYSYCTQSALISKFGDDVKFYRSRVYPGIESLESIPEYGYIENFYINGMPSQTNANKSNSSFPMLNYGSLSETNNCNDNYSILDGVLLSRRVYNCSEVLVQETINDWKVLSYKKSVEGNSIPLQGGYVLLKKITRRQGLSKPIDEEINYDLYSGQSISKSYFNYNAQGQKENWTEEKILGYTQYPILAALNNLNTVISEFTTVKYESSEEILIVSSVATRLKSWVHSISSDTTLTILAIFDSYEWKGVNSGIFTAWDINKKPDANWKFTSAIAIRDNKGTVLESINEQNIATSYIYDVDSQFKVAECINASVSKDQFSFLSFEIYEQIQGWQTTSGASWKNYTTSASSITGMSSLLLVNTTSKNTSISRRFLVNLNQTDFILSFWYKSDNNFLGNSTSGFQIRSKTNVEFFPFKDTNSEWLYVSYKIQGNNFTQISNEATVELEIVAQNTTTVAIYLDNLRFAPFLSVYSALNYNLYSGLVTSQSGPNNEISKIIIDDNPQSYCEIFNESIKTMFIEFEAANSLQGFSNKNPNASIQTTGKLYGLSCDFQRLGGYNKYWDTSDELYWDTKFVASIYCALHYSGQSESVISLKNYQLSEQFAFHFSIKPDNANLGSDFKINFGQDGQIKWINNKSQFQLMLDNVLVLSDGYVNAFPTNFMLYVYDQTLLFFADGEKIFFTQLNIDLDCSSCLSFSVSEPLSIYNVIFIKGPMIAIEHLDGLEEVRQAQELIDGTAVVYENLYDGLGRPMVVTKPAKVRPSQGATLFSYIPDFVISFNSDTGIMNGIVNEYYPDDDSYPYKRTLYEDSPLTRVKEIGLPGFSYAIKNISTSLAENRRTEKYSYYPNRKSDNFMEWLPEGYFFVTKKTDADGNVSINLVDLLGNTVGQGNLNEDSSTYTLTTSLIKYTGNSKSVTTYLPNYYNPRNYDTADNWVTTNEFDITGNNIRNTTPNSGNVENIYDLLGNLRFWLNEVALQNKKYCYNKYDILGRIIENGILNGDWDPVTLQNYADNNPNWPTSDNQVVTTYQYDGDGTDPCLIGKLVTTKTSNYDEDVFVSNTIEEFKYNNRGLIIKKTETIISIDLKSKSFITEYNYNNAHMLISVYYPENINGNIQQLIYDYNQLGLLKSIYSKSMDITLVSYSYNPDKSIKSEEIYGNSNHNIRSVFEYNSPGWLLTLKNDYFSQQNYYEQANKAFDDENENYYSGLISSQLFQFADNVSTVSNLMAGYGYNFRYNTNKQLSSGKNFIFDKLNLSWSYNPTFSFGQNNGTEFDANGNVLELTVGDQDFIYSYESNSDKLQQTNTNDSSFNEYNQIGALISSYDLQINDIKYNLVTERAYSIRTSNGNIAFLFNSSNARVAKIKEPFTNKQQIQFYCYGVSSSPIYENLVNTQGQIINETQLIYGSRGLIGFVRDNKFFPVLTDIYGSSRVILDKDDTIVSAYNYQPYGEFLDFYESNIQGINYLFTGQEFDKELTLYNYKNRFYDSSVRRFINIDAVGEFSSPYLYVGNNPIMFIDPTGNMTEEAGWAIVGGVGFIALGVIIAVATAGFGTPVLLASSAAASALISAGTASISYSIENKNSWDIDDWGTELGINAGIGFATGFAFAGSGKFISVATSKISTAPLLASRQSGGFIARTLTKQNLTRIFANGTADSGIGLISAKATADARQAAGLTNQSFSWKDEALWIVPSSFGFSAINIPTTSAAKGNLNSTSKNQLRNDFALKRMNKKKYKFGVTTLERDNRALEVLYNKTKNLPYDEAMDFIDNLDIGPNNLYGIPHKTLESQIINEKIGAAKNIAYKKGLNKFNSVHRNKTIAAAMQTYRRGYGIGILFK